MRRRLAPGVRMYTGDDFNYAELIAGDGQGYSDALLGIFDAIAPAASAALVSLAKGDAASFHDILAPTVPLSRHIFRAPTRFYKTGVVFMAYLNGHQNHFTMVGGQESARSTLHLAELFRLADAAGLLRDPDLAAPAHADRARRARGRGVRETSFARFLGRSPLAVDQHRDAAQAGRSFRHHRCLRKSGDRRDFALARSGRGGRARPRRPGGEGGRARAVRLLPRGHVSGRPGSARAKRGTTIAARWTRRSRSARPVSFSSSAACRNSPAPDRSPSRDLGRGARDGGGRHRHAARLRQGCPDAARHRAAASRIRRRPGLREHPGPGARSLRPARPGAHGPARRRARCVSRLVGPGRCQPRSPAPGRTGCSPIMSATGSCRRAICSTTAA